MLPTLAYCPVGYVVNAEQSGCDACPAGTFGNQNATMRYSNSTGCIPCPTATYSAAEGIDSVGKCIQCSPGKRGRGAGGASTETAGCQDCGIGEYTNSTGKASCSLCPFATTTSGSGQTLCAPCEAGKYLDTATKTCKKCDTGKQALAGSLECSASLIVHFM